MISAKKTPALIWRLTRIGNRLVRRLIPRGLGPKNLVLVLTTTGRKSGLPRQTPLQFELIDGVYYVGSARGVQADWYRNLVANPKVQVQVQGRRFNAAAEPVTDPQEIADFLEIRLRRHPKMIGMMMRAEGLPKNFNRADLERLSSRLAVVALHSCGDGDKPDKP